MPNLHEPHKMGKVMWAKTEFGEMVPYDLHGKLTREDEELCSKVFHCLRMYRKIGPALQIISNGRWGNMPIVKPFLMATLSTRSDARMMKITDDWKAFWFNL